MNVLVVIPARGGSKGIPRKNVKYLAGKPLITWTIELALGVRVFSRVIVSTDDDEIADVSRMCGASVPFMRPAGLASCNASGEDVMEHALKQSQECYSEVYDWVMLLQPTSPLRDQKDISSVIDVAKQGGVDTVVSVREVSEPPQWMKFMRPDGTLEDFMKQPKCGPTRQSLELPYIVNGAIYMVRSELLMDGRGMYGGVTKGVEMPQERSIDIDTLLEFRIAEMLIKERGIEV
ncbi:cytidylyltransferase domain-containing protein [Rubritalea sp.]|uniref:acylneuraminate cytidylyltransferase family protein n=1 Tax=Rubritalea sp. TaxID=2109375 RepID=UPI003EF2B7A5